MKLSTFYKKLRHYNKSVVSKKTVILYLLNKRMSGEIGHIVDIVIDRDKHNVSIDIERNSSLNTLSIKDYKISSRHGDACLSWRNVTCQGNEKQWFERKFSKKRSVPIPQKYIRLVQTLFTKAPSRSSVKA